MKKPTDHYGKSASTEAVQARLAELERPYIGTPQACEAVSILVGNCARQLHALSQCMVRPDLADEVPAQTATTLNACKLARESIVEIESMLKPDTKRKAKP